MAVPSLEFESEPTLLGRVFRSMFGVVARHPVKLAAAGLLLAAAPAALIQSAHLWLGAPANGFGAATIDGLFKAAPYATLWSFVALVSWYDAERTRPDLGGLLSWAISAIPRVALTGILFALGVSLGGLLIIPGLLAWLAWSVALPVSTLEGLGPLRAIERSSELTRTFRSKILGLLLTLHVPLFAFGWLGGHLIANLGLPTDAGRWARVGFFAVHALIAEPMEALLATALYLELRRRKEGLLPREAEVFD
jgi:hypothetical protein